MLKKWEKLTKKPVRMIKESQWQGKEAFIYQEEN